MTVHGLGHVAAHGRGCRCLPMHADLERCVLFLRRTALGGGSSSKVAVSGVRGKMRKNQFLNRNTVPLKAQSFVLQSFNSLLFLIEP
jgi:hypothetical protein